ncbi:uncharacterized protein LOC141571135 [Rhinolophus sinicus]|uniref:uncharacterized protein LOC141571135 n=1 Tax=Rhinolophus sinicus TaxID=89399 RepID=UPI003D79C256
MRLCHRTVTKQGRKLLHLGAAPETQPPLTDSLLSAPCSFLPAGAVQKKGLETQRSPGRKDGALTPLSGQPGPAAPPGSFPARAAFNPATTPSDPEAPGDPKGRGEARVRGQGAVAAGPAGPRPSRHPHPAPHPHPGPQAAPLALLRPRLDPRPPARRRRPRAPPRPPDQSERRWQWTRKLGCRCYCSPLGSGESLSLSSKRAKKAGLPGLHKKRQQPPTAPLQALRGHNTREPLLCPPKRQLSYHLGGRGKGGEGEKCTRSRQSTNFYFSSLGKNPHRPSTPASGGKSREETGDA